MRRRRPTDRARRPRRTPVIGAAFCRVARVGWLAILVAFLVLPARNADAGPIDPALRFHRADTRHFTIYYHQGEEALAARLIALVEEVRTSLGVAMHREPPAHTHVILADQTELANGWASPLPRDTVFLNAAAPSGAEFIGNTDDWLRLVFTHEYTHVVHLDRSEGWARIGRMLLGRSPYVFPNLTLPQWQIEGIATWEESALTRGGRARAGDFRAIERVAAQSDRPLRLDRSSGGLTAWPAGNAVYAAGLGFHEYLAGRYGPDSLARLADATARRLPYFGVGAFKGVYGQSLGALWRAYDADLQQRVGGPSAPASAATMLTHVKNAVVSGPRFATDSCAGCGDRILYSLQSADAFPSLRQIDLNGQNDRRVSLRYLGATVGVSADTIVFDQQDVHRSVGMYADLYAVDRGSGAVRRLSREARLQDPDVAPDGRRVVATREHGGQRDVMLVTLSGAGDDIRVADISTVISEPATSFSAPRWSPDGARIVVERHRLGSMPGIVIVDASTRSVVLEFGRPDARIVTPTWRPDGRAVVAAASVDHAHFELYEFELGEARRARRLTTTEGALWPDVRRDGRLIAYAGYTPDGFALFTMPYPRLAVSSDLMDVRVDPIAAPSTTASAAVPRERYSPWRTLAPTSWSPFLFDDGDALRAGGAVSGGDVLGRHSYGVDVSRAVRGPSVVRTPDSRTPDWTASYAYTRLVPTLFATASRQTRTTVVVTPDTREAASIALIERQAQAGVVLPVTHVLRRTNLLASLVRTDNQYVFADRTRDVRLVSARIALAHSTARRYGYSISREHGVAIGSTLDVSSRTLGSQANATTATADARAFLPGLDRHHVLALRAAAGMSNGATLARQRFTLGATAASASVMDFGGDALGLLRGASDRLVAGSRIASGTIEYRMPLATIERGHGTWPVFAKTVHAAAFIDAGRVGGVTAASTAWRQAVGAELSLDGVVGYVLPFTLTVGVSRVRDVAPSTGTSAYVRLGHAF